MANLTIVIDEEVLRRARMRALERGTSVNAIVADYLEGYAGPSPAAEALASFLELADAARAGSGGDRRWARADLHDRSSLR